VFFDSPYTPIVSNHPVFNTLTFDDCKHTFAENSPVILQGKEEQLPLFLMSTY